MQKSNVCEKKVGREAVDLESGALAWSEEISDAKDAEV